MPHPGQGWLTGWMAGRPAAIRLGTREVFSLPSSGAIGHIAGAGSRLGAVTFAADRTSLSVYELPGGVAGP